MGEYLFRFPAETPELDFGTLTAWMGLRDSRKIGTTVTVTAIPETGGGPARFEIWLYETLIACVGPDEVSFPGPDDPHMATTEWIAKVIRDNGIGGGAGRVRRRKADGPGPWMSRGQAGLLAVDYDREQPVIGHAYPVDPLRIAADRQWAAEFQARREADRERYAAESRRREALKTWTGPEGTFYACDEHDMTCGSYWRAVDATFRDGGASYDTVGYVHDTRPGTGASPEPDGTAVFAAFAGADRSTPEGSLGAFVTLAGALAAIANRAVARQVVAP